MSSGAMVIDISKYSDIKGLNTAFDQAAASEEMAFVVINGHLFCLSPASVAREAIATKIAKRLAEEPTILHDIQTRLESEEAVDWE